MGEIGDQECITGVEHHHILETQHSDIAPDACQPAYVTGA